ncbi:MAG: nitroreductase family protein [Candidatus Aminicenantales bacterium]
MPPFIDIVRSRRSIRRFLPRPVEKEKILACLEAARLAPSSHNSQPSRFVVIDEPGLKATLCREAFSGIYKMSQFAAQAPVIIVVMAAKDVVAHRLGRRIQGVSFHLIDIGIAGEHLVLQAEELGLATCWMGWFNGRRVRRVLKPPRKFEVVALLPIGYAASRPPRETVRKPLAEIAWWNGFGRADEDGKCGKDGTQEK